jgi:hypothetical protein
VWQEAMSECLLALLESAAARAAYLHAHSIRSLPRLVYSSNSTLSLVPQGNGNSPSSLPIPLSRRSVREPEPWAWTSSPRTGVAERVCRGPSLARLPAPPQSHGQHALGQVVHGGPSTGPRPGPCASGEALARMILYLFRGSCTHPAPAFRRVGWTFGSTIMGMCAMEGAIAPYAVNPSWCDGSSLALSHLPLMPT